MEPIWSSGLGHRTSGWAIGAAVYQCCEFKSRRGKSKTLTAQKLNSNTVWFYFQTYIIFSINLVTQETLRTSGTDILYGCHVLRCLHNILYFLWLYNEFFIILYNILKITELDYCQIIKLSIYVPSTHAYLQYPMSISRFSLYDMFMARMWTSGLGCWT